MIEDFTKPISNPPQAITSNYTQAHKKPINSSPQRKMSANLSAAAKKGAPHLKRE
jgi:hypothetical protein